MTHRLIAPAVLALALAGCANPDVPPEVANPPAPVTAEAQPAQSASTAPPAPQTASAAPSTTSDPGCDTIQLARVLYGVEQAFKQGAFDLKGAAQLDRVEVAMWALQLAVVEDEAGLDVYKATVKAKDSLKSYLDSPEGSAFARVAASTVQYSMTVLAQRCGMDAAYTFADPRSTGAAAE